MIEEVVLYKKKGGRRPLNARRTRVRVGGSVPQRKKPKSLSKLKKELDRLFSLWIRAKYPKRCYTCDRAYPNLQCGHFVSRQYLATRWEESNCRPQCMVCNVRLHGNILEFEERLIKELGAQKVQELKDSRKQLLRLTEEYYTTNIDKYQKELERVDNSLTSKM